MDADAATVRAADARRTRQRPPPTPATTAENRTASCNAPYQARCGRFGRIAAVMGPMVAVLPALKACFVLR
ncbi:hypothetical protein UK82_11850 [Frankia sp. ACN1ag]|nr:hypothetical protein UK82_11850 [Frankia sp. ACN1ag]